MNRNPFQVGDQVRQASGYMKLPEPALGEVAEVDGERVTVVWKNGNWAPSVGHYSYFEPAVRKGYRLTGSGFEVYDIKAHIKRAFEGLPIGASLNMKQIQDRGQRDNIPASKSVLLSVIMVRVQALCEGRQAIEGLAGNYDSDGRCIVYKVMDQKSMPKAISNPKSECCGRDMADCDCHPLTIMYTEALKSHKETRRQEAEELAREVAIDLIITSGLPEGARDMLGESMGDTVQSLLMVALLREPRIARVLEQILDKHNGVRRVVEPRVVKAGVTKTWTQAMIIGRRYKVRYQIPGMKVVRECLVEYVGEEADKLVFSGRPTFGTIHINKSWITSTEWMIADVECYVDKIVK